MDENKEIARRSNIKKWIEIGIFAAIIVAFLSAAYWWLFIRTRVYTDSAMIDAPLIQIGPESPTVLKEILVKEGDMIATSAPVARMDGTYLLTSSSGLVVGVNDSVGALFSPGQAVVTMIDPSQLRLVARVDENAGLSDIKPGDKVVFTLDAYGSKKFDGTVDQIIPTSYESGVIFNISDTRQEQQYEVKISYDALNHPEILNGMSARVWIYK